MGIRFQVINISFVVLLFGLNSWSIESGKMKMVGLDPCPENSTSENDFPGFNPDRPKSFSRDEDEAGLCKYFTDSDYLCFKLNKMGVFDKLPKAIGDEFKKSGCSALDLYVHTYEKACKDVAPNTLDSAFALSSDGNPPHCAMRKKNGELIDDKFILSVAAEVGICPESLVPSEYGSTQNTTGPNLRGIMSALEKRIASKTSTEANAAEIGICPECALSGAGGEGRLKDIRDLVAAGRPENSFSVLKKITEIKCDESVRRQTREAVREVLNKVSVAVHSSNFPLANLLSGNDVAIVNTHSAVFNPFVEKDQDSGHSVLVFTDQLVLNVSALYKGQNILVNKCYYLVKNSWGPHCSEIRDKVLDYIKHGITEINGNRLVDDDGTPIVRCARSGAFVVPYSSLDTHFNNFVGTGTSWRSK